jgi:hypothetical protein
MMNLKYITATAATTALLTSGASAALLINFGNAAADGQGPTGADASYQAYNTPHESSTSGQLETYTGTTFTGLGGTYDVDLSLSWSETTGDPSVPNSMKQSIDRGSDPAAADFLEDWVGIDARTVGTTGEFGIMTLSLAGLEADSFYTLTTYHWDTNNITADFTTDLTGTTVFSSDSGGAPSTTELDDVTYDWTLTTDSSGVTSIAFEKEYLGGAGSADFFVINGFDLEYASPVPEPSAFALIAGMLGLTWVMLRRRG